MLIVKKFGGKLTVGEQEKEYFKCSQTLHRGLQKRE